MTNLYLYWVSYGHWESAGGPGEEARLQAEVRAPDTRHRQSHGQHQGSHGAWKAQCEQAPLITFAAGKVGGGTPHSENRKQLCFLRIKPKTNNGELGMINRAPILAVAKIQQL